MISDTETLPQDIPATSLPAGVSLVRTKEGIVLTDGTLTLLADFASMEKRLRPENLSRELLVRAAGLKGRLPRGEGRERLLVVDATAGLGQDSLLLAAAGSEVILCEKNPVIFALLDDALKRARQQKEDTLLAGAAIRMHPVCGDSTELLTQRGEQWKPDVVYLDPMFPQRRKSGLVKKKFQLLHQIEQPCPEADAQRLLAAAVGARPQKVVVKRPLRGPALAGAKVSYSLRGKKIRYDCIVL